MLESSLPPTKWQLPVEVNMARWPSGYPAIVKVVLTTSTAFVCLLLCLYTLWNSHTDQDSTAHKFFTYWSYAPQPVFINKKISFVGVA